MIETDDLTIDTRAATPELVFAVLQDWYRHARACGDADSTFTLRMDSTIAEWREAYDLLDWRAFAVAMNDEWEISVPLDEWLARMEPAAQRTVRGVCELISCHAVVPKIRPAWFIGAPCLSAGAFLAVRVLLQKAHADVDQIAPSTPLAEYTRQYARTFHGPITRLAPGALPDVKVVNRSYDGAILGILVGIVLLGLGLCASLPPISISGVLIWLMSYLAASMAAGHPEEVTFGELTTFKDLAITLANQAPPTELT